MRRLGFLWGALLCCSVLAAMGFLACSGDEAAECDDCCCEENGICMNIICPMYMACYGIEYQDACHEGCVFFAHSLDYLDCIFGCFDGCALSPQDALKCETRCAVLGP